MSHLSFAIDLAQEYHGDQTDKTGQPFIGHPLRVMALMPTETEKVVAVLHDLVEDTAFTVQQLEYMFPAYITDAVDAISRRKGETYKQFIARCAQNPIAKSVKGADITDNADPRRQWTGAPISRYRWAWAYLFPDEPLPPGLAK